MAQTAFDTVKNNSKLTPLQRGFQISPSSEISLRQIHKHISSGEKVSPHFQAEELVFMNGEKVVLYKDWERVDRWTTIQEKDGQGNVCWTRVLSEPVLKKPAAYVFSLSPLYVS